MKSKLIRILFVILLLISFVLFQYFELGEYFSLEYIKLNQHLLMEYYLSHKLKTIILYFFLYVVMTTLSLPGASILTISGGALFGLFYGMVIVSFASSIGATFSFLISRFFFREYVQLKFRKYLKVFNEGIVKDGASYLFSLRLFPLFPFFIINLVMGVTPIKTATFYYISQLGMLLGTLVYINAGVELAKISKVSDILSPTLFLSFTLLGLLPILGKRLVALIRRNRTS